MNLKLLEPNPFLNNVNKNILGSQIVNNLITGILMYKMISR